MGNKEGKLGEREVGVKAEKEVMERRSCEGRDETEHTSTDPLLYDITWRMLHCSEPSLGLEKAERRVERAQEQPFLFLP